MTDHDDLSMNRFPEDENNLEREIKAMLEYETNKPEEFRDYESIDLLLRKLVKLQKLDERTQRRTQAGIHVVQSAIQNQYKKQPSRKLRCVVLAACAVLILVPNIWSYTVYGMNAISATITYMEKGVILDYNQDNEADHISTSAGNPYAETMRNICKDYGYEALVPTYLPEGFEPNPDIEFGHRTISDDPLILSFKFVDSPKKPLFGKRNSIMFDVFFHQTDNITRGGFPCDEHNITEQTIHDTTITISQEDNQFHAMFLIDRTLYHLYTSGIDYEEAQQILESVFEEQQAV